MLSIDLSSLRPGANRLRLEPDAVLLNLEPTEFHEIVVDADVDFRRTRVIVQLSVGAMARLVCDRTLAEFTQPISGSYLVVFAADGDAAPETDDVRPFSAGDKELDITDAVRDTLILAIPARRIAPGAAEVEIPTRFGEATEAEEIDPRWDVLRKLKSAQDH